MTAATTAWTLVPSPLGDLLLVTDGDALTSLLFTDDERPAVPIGVRDDAAGVLQAARAELVAYFARDLTEFTVPVASQGSPFQQQVWSLLRTIPYGTTTSYGVLARRMGKPHAARAVGLANGANPLAVIVPCHRVVGSTGALTGYGGGMWRKRLLLDLEMGLPFAEPGMMTG